MANSITKEGVVVIDTVSAVTPAFVGRGRIKTIRWVGATTQGHKATLKSSSGEIIWDATAPLTPSHELESFVERWITNDLLCTALQSGVLYVSLI